MKYTVKSVVDSKSGISGKKKKNRKIIKKAIMNNSVNPMLVSSPDKVCKVKKSKKKKSKVQKQNGDDMVVIIPKDVKALDEEQGSGMESGESNNEAQGSGKESTESDHEEQGSGIESEESDDEDNKETKPIKRFDSTLKARTIFVGNLPATVSKDKLIRLFRPYGQIERVRRSAPENPMIGKEKSINAQVVFCKEEDAFDSLVLNGTKFEGHYLTVAEYCDSSIAEKGIHIRQLHKEAEEKDVWEAFISCGEMESLRVGRGKFGAARAYISFKSIDSVELALQMKDVKIKDKICSIKRCNNSKYQKVTPVTMKSIGLKNGSVSTTILITQLNSKAENNDLREAFKSCGEIDSVKVLQNKLGVNTGAGYVSFNSINSVEVAYHMKDVKIKERICRIYKFKNARHIEYIKFLDGKRKELKNYKQITKKKYNKKMAQTLKLAGKVPPTIGAE